MFTEFRFGTHTKHASGKLLSVIQRGVMRRVRAAFSLLFPVKHLAPCYGRVKHFDLGMVISTEKKLNLMTVKSTK